MSAKALLFDGDHVRVIAQDIGTPDVIVTFNEFGTVSDGLAFWGDELLARCGISAFGVMTSAPNWYPREEMSAAAQAIAAACHGRRIVTYGHSQGGYGALKYAAALGARLSVAFCPQWSIAPKAVGDFDARYTHFNRPELANGLPVTAADLGPASVIVYDPHEPVDRIHADRLLPLPGVSRVLCPFSGHETIRLPAETGLSADLIELLRQDEPGPALRRLLRAARSRSATYATRRFEALLARGRLDLCAKLAPVLGEQAGLRLELAQALATGATAQAEDLLLSCDEATLSSLPLVELWNLCRRHDLRRSELRIALLLRGSGDIFMRLHLVNTLTHFDLPDQARAELDRILALPEAGAHRALIAPHAARLGITRTSDKSSGINPEGHSLESSDDPPESSQW